VFDSIYVNRKVFDIEFLLQPMFYILGD